MKFFSVFLLPLLVAGEQKPLKDKVTEIIAETVDPAARKLAQSLTERINLSNWSQKLKPKLEGPQEYVLYLNGGNKTCFGDCGRADAAWALAVPLLSALPSSPHLAHLNCEYNEQLCTAWSASIPSLWHFALPQKPGDPLPTPKTPLHIVPLNLSSVTSAEIVEIVRDKTYLKPEYSYDGAFHPVDGWIAKLGLLLPLGYVLWGFGTTPSWLVMIVISFFTRQWMAKRSYRGLPAQAGAAAGAPPAAAADGEPAVPAPATAGKASGAKPAKEGKSAKKRK